MARDAKIEVAAVNVRIADQTKRDYLALMLALAGLRRGVNIYSETVVAIQSFNTADSTGAFSKFTEIDVKGDWFNVELFSPATAEDKADINIPEKLRPNHSAFYFTLNKSLHSIAFETYSGSKTLSAFGVEKYFREACLWPEIINEFGQIDVDLVKSYDEAEKLLHLPDLKEVKFTIRRPNADDLGDNLAAEIEARLRKVNGGEYEETIRSAPNGSIAPDERSRKLALVAAENGEMSVRHVVNGVVVPSATTLTPLKEVEKFKSGVSLKLKFLELSEKLFGKIDTARSDLNESR